MYMHLLFLYKIVKLALSIVYDNILCKNLLIYESQNALYTMLAFQINIQSES